MKIGIIGLGNLGKSLTEGLLKSAVACGDDICICDKAPEALDLARNTYGVCASDDVNFVIERSDVVFFVVKSYVFEEVSKDIKREILSGKTFVSFMAGVTFEKIFSLIGQVDLVRGMPSLAISVCDGVIGYTAAPDAVVEIFCKLGYAFEVNPDEIEKVMAFSSCGLGFAAYLLDAFSKAGEKMGFDSDSCEKIAAQTFRNAIDRGNYSQTVKAVATKGGATEQGVLHMDACKVNVAIENAVLKAYEKMK